MTDKNLDKLLKGFDYSEFSKVKEDLLAKLLFKHYTDNLGRMNYSNELMTDEELDYAVAAGNPNSYIEDDKNKLM